MSPMTPRSRVCYDLAYSIVEKWLLDFLSEPDNYNMITLGFNFFKIMMTSQQFKKIFLRLLKQNFGSCSIFGLIRGGSMHIKLIKNEESAPPSDDCYGIINNLWFYAFLLINDVSLRVNSCLPNSLRNKENRKSFDISETPKESLMLCLYDECAKKVLKGGLQKGSIDTSYPRSLECYYREISDPAGVIQRLFNVNANMLQLTMVSNSNVSLSSALQLSQPGITADIRYQLLTEHVHLFVEKEEEDDITSDVALFNPSALWKWVSLYALQVCPEMKELFIEFVYRYPVGEFQDFLLINLAQTLDCLKQEILPKLLVDATLILRMSQVSDFGMDNRLVPFLLEQGFSVVENNNNDLLRMSYNADSRFKLEWDHLL